MAVSAAMGLWEGSSQLSRRIAMLLDETFRVEPTGSRRWKFRALGVLVLLGAACSLVTLQPARSIGQQPQTTSSAEVATGEEGEPGRRASGPQGRRQSRRERWCGPKVAARPQTRTAGDSISSEATLPGSGASASHLSTTTTTSTSTCPGAPTPSFFRSHAEGFLDFYKQRTLYPGVGRMDVSDVHSASGQPANIAMPGAIDLPTYQLLLQPSVQRALNLSEEQRTKLQDISAKYWPERRQIAGKELDDMETTSQRELAVDSAKAGRSGVCPVKHRRREQFAFFQRGRREIGAAMEQRPQTDRRRAHARAVADAQGLDLPHIRLRQRSDV